MARKSLLMGVSSRGSKIVVVGGWVVTGKRTASTVSEIGTTVGTNDNDAISRDFVTFYKNQTPVVVRKLVNHWPALSKWPDLDYLARTVPPNTLCEVEIGAYHQGDKLTVPFENYIDYLKLFQEQYEDSEIEAPTDQLLYLAQNDMQSLPGLEHDVSVPFLCTDRRFGLGHQYSRMIWMGPKGCISPLHYDPLDNLLMQIVGRKAVKLLPRNVPASSVGAGDEYGQQYNTSSLNMDQVDHLPEDVQSQLLHTVLEPGDALYIPYQWWHYVRSLDSSISVNAWWR